VVQRHLYPRGVGGLLAGARMHRVSSRRFCHLGGDPRRARQAHQENRRPQRILPAVHPAELPAKGGATRRGVRARACGRYARRRQGARRAANRASHLRDDHQPYVRAVDQIASRLADDAQSMVQRRAMGDAHPHVPAHYRVPLAGGAHGARHARGSRTRNAHDARGVPAVRRGVPVDSADRRTQKRGRAIPAPSRPIRSRV